MKTLIHRVVRITAILKQSAYLNIMDALHKTGIDNLHLESGREPVLEERMGLRALLTGGDSLASEPVRAISFFVPEISEESFLHIMAIEGKLHIPGMGILYSENVDLYQNRPLCHPGKPTWHRSGPVHLLSDVAGIKCLVPRGDGDRIVRAVLEAGFAVPTVTYGYGMGLRDKLGILRVTIPPEKEVITLIIAAHDREAAMELMIEEGKLDRAGRGYIYSFPVRKAILNTRIMRGGRTHAASMEQIVTAIDSMKGNMEWWVRGMGTTEFKKRDFLDNHTELLITCDEGHARDIVYTAMHAGVGGATITRARFVDTGIDPEMEHVARARESISMNCSRENLGPVLQAMEDYGVLELGSHSTIHTRPIPLALTYSGEHSGRGKTRNRRVIDK